MQAQEGSLIGALLPMILISIPMAVIGFRLATQKGHSVLLWTLVGLIPGFNFFAGYYFAGASDRKLEAKVDRLMQLVEAMARDEDMIASGAGTQDTGSTVEPPNGPPGSAVD